jgi:hypothetical protein
MVDGGRPRSERLWARIAEGRYTSLSRVVQILDPPVEPIAYEARLRAAQAIAPALLPVLRVQADALVVDGLAGEPTRWPLTPGSFVTLCGLVAPLHAAGALQHGAAIDAFRSWNLQPCVRCGEPFARADPPETTMFDGQDAVTGRRFGGRTSRHRSECLVCRHIEVRVEREAYR